MYQIDVLWFPGDVPFTCPNSPLLGKATYFDPDSEDYADQSLLLHFLLIVMGLRLSVHFYRSQKLFFWYLVLNITPLVVHTYIWLRCFFLTWNCLQRAAHTGLQWFCPLCRTQGEEKTLWEANPQVTLDSLATKIFQLLAHFYTTFGMTDSLFQPGFCWLPDRHHLHSSCHPHILLQ